MMSGLGESDEQGVFGRAEGAAVRAKLDGRMLDQRSWAGQGIACAGAATTAAGRRAQSGPAPPVTALEGRPQPSDTIAAADPPRGHKRTQSECSGQQEMSTRELNRLEGNAVRLRGLLRNSSATPDKRRFSLDLQSQIVMLERTVASGKAEQDLQHVDVRARLDDLSL